MKNIIHFSDIHIGFKNCAERFERFVNQLIAQKGSQPEQYVLVITGDLVENANIPGIYDEAQKYLDTLREAGFKHILIVPGNHDYGTGDAGNQKFVPLFQRMFFGKEIEFPKKDIIEDVAFIGLDSMAEELHWYDRFFAEGQIGAKQLNRLEAMLDDEDVRQCSKRVIYLHHHPFKGRPFHQLKDSNQLKDVLERAMDKGITIDALLFGHNHEGKAHNGRWGIPRCYDAGSVTEKPRPKYLSWCPCFQIKNSTRMIDLENDNVDEDSLFE